MTNYTIVSRFRNKDAVLHLIEELKKRGKTCYNFCEMPADPNNPLGDAEEQMKVFELEKDFLANPYYRKIFERDLNGLKHAQAVILLLPAGTSAHIEIGIAYGLGKKCILIGKPLKPETLYLLFDEYHERVENFLASL